MQVKNALQPSQHMQVKKRAGKPSQHMQVKIRAANPHNTAS